MIAPGRIGRRPAPDHAPPVSTKCQGRRAATTPPAGEAGAVPERGRAPITLPAVVRCQPFLIRGATLVDGSGGPPVVADVRVGSNGRVAEIVSRPGSLAPDEGDGVIAGRVQGQAPALDDAIPLIRSQRGRGPGPGPG